MWEMREAQQAGQEEELRAAQLEAEEMMRNVQARPRVERMDSEQEGDSERAAALAACASGLRAAAAARRPTDVAGGGGAEATHQRCATEQSELFFFGQHADATGDDAFPLESDAAPEAVSGGGAPPEALPGPLTELQVEATLRELCDGLESVVAAVLPRQHAGEVAAAYARGGGLRADGGGLVRKAWRWLELLKEVSAGREEPSLRKAPRDDSGETSAREAATAEGHTTREAAAQELERTREELSVAQQEARRHAKALEALSEQLRESRIQQRQQLERQLGALVARGRQAEATARTLTIAIADAEDTTADGSHPNHHANHQANHHDNHHDNRHANHHANHHANPRANPHADSSAVAAARAQQLAADELQTSRRQCAALEGHVEALRVQLDEAIDQKREAEMRAHELAERLATAQDGEAVAGRILEALSPGASPSRVGGGSCADKAAGDGARALFVQIPATGALPTMSPATTPSKLPKPSARSLAARSPRSHPPPSSPSHWLAPSPWNAPSPWKSPSLSGVPSALSSVGAARLRDGATRRLMRLQDAARSFWLNPLGGGALARALWLWQAAAAHVSRRQLVEEARRLRGEKEEGIEREGAFKRGIGALKAERERLRAALAEAQQRGATRRGVGEHGERKAIVALQREKLALLEELTELRKAREDAQMIEIVEHERAQPLEPQVRARPLEPQVRAQPPEPQVCAQPPEPQVRAQPPSPQPQVRAHPLSARPEVRARPLSVDEVDSVAAGGCGGDFFDENAVQQREAALQEVGLLAQELHELTEALS